MKTIAGIFRTRENAEEVIQALRSAGFGQEQLSLLLPQGAVQDRETVSPTETEQPGMGKALGTVAGAAAGFSGGFLGVAAFSLFLPGVGPIVAIGSMAGALLGIAGAAVGAAAGHAIEKALTTSLPQDELFVYEDALRKGRSVVIALADDEAQAETVRNVFSSAGVETLDAAREQWWLGLRDAEETAYATSPGQFRQVELTYRQGFEAALNPRVRGKSYEEAADFLRTCYPAVYLEEPFRRGYDRGQAHQQGVLERYQREMAEEYRIAQR